MKKQIAFAVLCSAFTITTASAHPFTNADAIAEAETNLTSCDNIPKEAGCPFNRARFIKEYQNAYAGDHLAQENIAYNLWKGEGQDRDQPFRMDTAAGCAWQTIATATPNKSGHNDVEDRNLICNNPPLERYEGVYPTPDAAVQVRDALKRIRSRIRAHTVHRVNVEEIEFDVKRDGDEDHAGIGRNSPL